MGSWRSAVAIACAGLVAVACSAAHGPGSLEQDGPEPMMPAGSREANSPEQNAPGQTPPERAPRVGSRDPDAPEPNGSEPGSPEPGAGRDSPDRMPLVAISVGERVQLLAEDGSLIRELPPFDGIDPGASSVAFTLQIAPDYALLVRQAWFQAPLSPAQPVTRLAGARHMILLRRPSWERVWQRNEARVMYPDNVMSHLGPSGHVALLLPNEQDSSPYAQWRTLVIAPNGTEYELPGAFDPSAPDADGHVGVRLATPLDGVASPYGFMRIGEPGLRELAEPLLIFEQGGERHALQPLRGPGPRFEYLTEQAGEVTLVVETPAGVERIALGSPPPDSAVASLQRGESGWLVTVRDGSTYAERPWLGVDRDGSLRELDRAVPEGVQTTVWGLGSDWFNVRGASLVGWINAATGEWKAAPEPPPGLRRFDTEYCRSTLQLGADGRVLTALRDEETAQVYLDDARGDLEPVGRPIYGAVFVDASRYGQTTVLSAMRQNATYCPPAQWPAQPPAADLLLGGQTEIVRGAHSLVIDDPHAGVIVHPTGRFAAVRSSAGHELHDLEQGVQFELPDGAAVIDWF